MWSGTAETGCSKWVLDCGGYWTADEEVGHDDEELECSSSCAVGWRHADNTVIISQA